MKFSGALLFLIGGSAVQETFGTTDESGLGKLTGCFLRDLQKYRESREIVEESLSASNENVFEYVEGSSKYSIRCDIDGEVDQVDYILQPDGETHETWGAPFWISGSRDDWVEPAEWLNFCGKKSLTIKAKTWDKDLFETTFDLAGVCGDKDADEEADEEPGSGDLNIYFNKFVFSGATPDFLPLTADDYPMGGSIATSLKNKSNADSVIIPGDPALRGLRPENKYLELVGGIPSFPNSDDDTFWHEFQEVVDLQLSRRADVVPSTIFSLPSLWSKFDIAEVAEAVRNEYPGSLQADLIQSLWDQDVKLDNDIIPFRSNTDFVGRNIMMTTLNTWAIGLVGAPNFYLKWFVGRPRPEEVAWKIAMEELTELDGVPSQTIEDIRSMKLTSAPSFTAYKEGSPRHPAWPAMHSASSSASFWIAVVLDLTDDQLCEALRTDFAVAFGRSVAGVHYTTDNTAGLNLGQQLVAEQLPAYLAENFGSDAAKVRAKVERLRFDWTNFDSRDCSTGR